MKRKIAVDMDGVLTGFVPAVCEETNRITGSNLIPADIISWDLRPFGIEDDYWIKPGFFRSLKPVPGAIETLIKWHKDIDFCIATDTMDINFVQQDKQAWIEEHVPFIEKVYYGRDKTIVPAEILIDDGPHHLQEWPRIKIKMIYPYNKNIEADYEVKDWRQIDKLFRNGILK